MTGTTQKTKDFNKGILFALLKSFCLGVLGIVDKLGATQNGISPLVFSTQSVLFGFFFITFFAVTFQRVSFIHDVKKTSFASWKKIMLVGIFASGIYTLLRFLGLTESTGTFASLGQVIITAITAIFAYLFLKEKLSNIFWFLFVIIIIATYFVSVGKLTLTTIQLGDSYILLGTVFVAIANILSKKVTNQTSPLVLTVGRFFFAGIFLLLINLTLFNNEGTLLTFSIWSVISGLLWSLNTSAYNLAMHKIGVTLATSILMLGPVITMILEYFVLKHIFNPIQIVAALVVITCGILMIKSK